MGAAELAQILIGLGLDPDALCAVGASPAVVTGVIDRAREHLITRSDALRNAIQSRDALAREVAMLGRAARAEGSPAIRARLEQARTSLAQATATLTQLEDALAGIATEGFSPAALGALHNIRAGRRARPDIPVEYLVISRTDAEWTLLRDSLAHIRVQESLGQQVEPEIAILVAEANAVPQTAAARTNLALNRAGCASAFTQSLGVR